MNTRRPLMQNFGSKLTLLVSVTTGVAVFLVCAALVIVDHLQTRRAEVELANTHTEMAALYSEAPLNFGDPAMGEEALGALRASKGVAAATLYTPDGSFFAQYRAPEYQAPHFDRQANGTYVQDRWLIISRDVYGGTGDGETRLGQLQVIYDFNRVWPGTWLNSLIALAVAFATTVVAFAASTRLRHFLTAPVNELAGAARRVAETRDYSVRAQKFSDDELGQLTDVFNNMLMQVHRQAEDIQAGQKQFRLAVEAAPNAMVMVDEHGIIVLVNTQTETMFGYSREELVGQSVEILVPERFREKHPEYRFGFYRDPQARPMGAGRDLYGRHKRGHEFPVEVGLSPIQTEDGLRVLSSILDITERKRTEENTARLAAIVQYSNDAIISKTLDGIVTSFNPAAERMYGYKASEVVGQPINLLVPPPPHTPADEVESILHRLRHEQPIENYETVRMRKDGSLIEVSVTISPTRAADGRVIGASSIARDITDRKRAEQERVQLLEAERAARAEAERASRMKDEFVATLSHELRTPMSAILGWSQMLRSGEAAEGEIVRGLEVIERNARVQTQIIEDLLDMSRIVSGKIRLDVQQVNLVDVIEAAVATIRPAADAKQIRLQMTLDPRSAPVRGDPSRLQQVVWNLLTNAIKFTSRDGRVQVALERVNSHVEITVSDTGLGISAEFLPFLFERFRQADSSTTRQHSGLGLGLAIVKQLVELHGGTVHAMSPGEGKGSTFVVQLPLMVIHGREQNIPRTHPAVAGTAGTGLDRPDLSGIRVLVVDDEADGCDLVKRLLEHQGATVCCASSAAQALQEYARFKPHVLVSDIGMPEMDGYELMRQVRTLERQVGSHTPSLALTAFARPEDRMRALLAGFQLHMSKPVEPAELLIAVGSLATPHRHGPKPN